MTIKKIIDKAKQYTLTLFWDRRLLCYLFAKDFFKFMHLFNRRFFKNYNHFLNRYKKRNDEIVKKKRFYKFYFLLRYSDLLLLKEVFLDKDYSLLDEFLPSKGDIVIDVGAGIGDYTLLCSLRVANRGKVVSVEADKYTYEILLKNIKENKLKNVIPLNIFVSSKKEHSIDSIVKKLKLEKVNLIKMDIEGEEYNALKGSIKTTRKFKPKIVIEIHSKELRNKILEFLKKYGYDLTFEKVKKEHGFYLSYFKRK